MLENPWRSRADQAVPSMVFPMQKRLHDAMLALARRLGRVELLSYIVKMANVSENVDTAKAVSQFQRSLIVMGMVLRRLCI